MPRSLGNATHLKATMLKKCRVEACSSSMFRMLLLLLHGLMQEGTSSSEWPSCSAGNVCVELHGVTLTASCHKH